MEISEFKILIYLSIITLAAGCSPRHEIRYVPVENNSLRADTIFLHAERTDSVIDRDSVIIYIGDTVRVERSRWRLRIKERIDTLREVTLIRDTITKIVEIPIGGCKDAVNKRNGHKPVIHIILSIILTSILLLVILRYRKRIISLLHKWLK